jgi:hypothetical protein
VGLGELDAHLLHHQLKYNIYNLIVHTAEQSHKATLLVAIPQYNFVVKEQSLNTKL